jgi:hypothetical protein
MSQRAGLADMSHTGNISGKHAPTRGATQPKVLYLEGLCSALYYSRGA